MLYLVGETRGFDAATAHRLNGEGTIARISKGIYCDAGDTADLPAFMKKHAVRLAAFVYPEAALCGGSAYHKGAIDVAPGPDGLPHARLFVIGSYTYRRRLPHLDIVQSETLANDGYAPFCKTFRDGQEHEHGELRLRCAVDELVFLQNFGRRRYYPERFLGEPAMRELRRGLEERLGAGLPDRLRAIAGSCGDLGMELDRALAYLAQPLSEQVDLPANLRQLAVGWHGRKIAQISYDGMTWKFNYDKGWLLSLTLAANPRPGFMPAYIANMMPEGSSAEAVTALHIETGAKATLLDASERYLSNIVISEDPARLNAAPVDRLEGRLADFRRDGVFVGTIAKVPKTHGGFTGELRELVARTSMPRLSGFQAKLPMYLDVHGNMVPADNKPFTHILKFPGISRDPQYARGAVEWASMEMAKAAGLNVADSAMAKLPDGTIGLLSERFDVARDEDDMRMICAEDFCSIFGAHPNAKYHKSADEVGAKLREVSSNFGADGEDFFRQVCVNLLLENGDFHLKNLSMLKVATPMLDAYRSARLSPVYDVMSTRFFTDQLGAPDEMESMVFKVNGKDIGITLDDLLAFAAGLDIAPERARALAYAAAAGIAQRAAEISGALPPLLAAQPKVAALVRQVCARASAHTVTMFPDLEQRGDPAPAASRRRRP